MSAHYYTNKPDTAHEREQFTFELRGKQFVFHTDSNVFSKKTIDFGSRVLIEAFSDEGLPAGSLLDVGCGYGPMGMALSFATGRAAELVDVNERAVALANENIAANKLENIHAHVSYIYDEVLLEKYAAIVSNPPIRAGKEVVHAILSGAYDKLLSGGSLTIVIQKKQGAPSAQKKMQDIFGNVEVVTKEKGYFILRSVKEA